jgi:hypothetical protein
MADPGRLHIQSFSSRGEITRLAILLALFLCLFALVLARYPFVWIDEIQIADPAVNFVTGRGFTASAVYDQENGEFSALYVPMYQFLLVPWLKVFGISITSVRSIGFVHLFLFLSLSLVGGTRLGLLSDRTSRSCFVGALLGGYGMIFSYGSGRPDSLGMLLVGAYIFIYSVKIPWIRLGGFFLVGFLLPWTGLQLLPFVAVSGIVIGLYVGRRFLPLLIATALGSVLGLATLLLFYSYHGVLARFIVHQGSQPFTKLFVRGLFSGVILHHAFLPKDFSMGTMFLGAFIVVGMLYRHARRSFLRSPVFVSVVIALAVSFALVASARFPTYYSWMVYSPLVLGMSHCIGASSRGTWLRRIGVAACVLSGSIGVSLHALNLVGCWSDRSYSHVKTLVSQSVSRGQRVYAEYAAYYALHPITRDVYYPRYLSAMTGGEKAALDVLVIYPYNLASVRETVGGLWEPTGQQFTPASDGFFGARWEWGYLSVPNYALAVYRRGKPPVASIRAGK